MIVQKYCFIKTYPMTPYQKTIDNMAVIIIEGPQCVEIRKIIPVDIKFSLNAEAQIR